MNSIDFIPNCIGVDGIPKYFTTMMRCCYIIHIFLAVSMNSFIFPATRRSIRCHGFRPVGIVGKVDKDRICRYRYESHNLVSRKNIYRYHPFWSISSTSIRRYGDYDERDYFYESVSAFLFRQGKTWKRLSHLLDMATDGKEEAEKTMISPKSVADVGTDHGLLAMGLALSGNYNKVVGVDVSDQALTFGALALLEQIRNQTMSMNDDFFKEFPIEFRLGNGLEALEFGEADIICIAGMGVNTMLKILEQESSMNSEGTYLEKIGCKRLVLQATNSRPRNLILLYDRLQKMGWKVRDERIEKLSSRWYITTCFEMPNDAPSSIHLRESGQLIDLELPGLKLRSFDKTCSMRKIFDEYCLHHKQWIQEDAKASRQQIDSRDLRWLEYFFDEKM